MHHWHQANGARWIDAGQWKRPESYGDPAAEVRAVRTGAGLIDVSTLGKIEVIGPDAAELLERVYVNQWADLAVGRTRYGVMCTEEGIVFDDGVGARLGPRSLLPDGHDRQRRGRIPVAGTVANDVAPQRRGPQPHLGLRRDEPGRAAGTRNPCPADRRSTCPPRPFPTWPRARERWPACRAACCASASSANWATKFTAPAPTDCTCGKPSWQRGRTSG